MFGVSVYNRGGMTLVALREKIGQASFTRLPRTWVRRHQYGNATTEDFMRLAGEISGRGLGPFFRTWLYDRAEPRNW
ncbi:MAG TPA: M1 family aminopeptidase [Streptosporangiaceae bacterium]|jgi:aminopeptidase N